MVNQFCGIVDVSRGQTNSSDAQRGAARKLTIRPQYPLRDVRSRDHSARVVQQVDESPLIFSLGLNVAAEACIRSSRVKENDGDDITDDGEAAER